MNRRSLFAVSYAVSYSIRRLLHIRMDDTGSKQTNEKYTSFIDHIRTYCGNIDDTTILEIGSDWNGKLLLELKSSCDVKAVYGINLRSPNKELGDRIFHLKGDAENTGFKDKKFDYIFSLATFEHISDLPNVLRESWRILKDDGVLFTLFGPIWSAAWGHHLWVKVDNRTYNYNNTILPPYCHLISTEKDVMKYLARVYEYPKGHCEIIVNYIFNSKDQNRLFFDDYRKIFNESPFKIVLFAGHENTRLSGQYGLESYIETLKVVSRKYPRNKGQFGYSAITAILLKERAT